MNKIDFSTLPVFLIGSGNLATHLSIALNNKGLHFESVWSRNIENAKILSEKIKTNYTNNISELFKKQAIYLICVPDNNINNVAKQLNSSNSILIHTSASTNISVLKKYNANSGVFYPLQTFSKNSTLVNFKNLPIFIEYSNSNVKNLLTNWSKLINAKLYKANSEKRLLIHVAAIFANNFTNHMLAISQELAIQNNIDFELFKPLINETFEKIKKMNPSKSQTGPAIRNDKITIKKHLKVLHNSPDFAKIYSFVSNNIKEMHYKEK